MMMTVIMLLLLASLCAAAPYSQKLDKPKIDNTNYKLDNEDMEHHDDHHHMEEDHQHHHHHHKEDDHHHHKDDHHHEEEDHHHHHHKEDHHHHHKDDDHHHKDDDHHHKEDHHHHHHKEDHHHHHHKEDHHHHEEDHQHHHEEDHHHKEEDHHHHHHKDHHHHMEEEGKYHFTFGDFMISNSPFAVIFGDVKVTNTQAADDILNAGITEIGESLAAMGELTTALDIVGGLTALSGARKKRSGDEQSGDETTLLELVDRVTNLVEKCGNGDICDSNEIKNITQIITSTFNKMEIAAPVSTMFQNSFDEKKEKLDKAISAAEKTQGEEKIKALTALALALTQVCAPDTVNQEACFCQNVQGDGGNVCAAQQGCCACGTCLDVCIADAANTNACFCENVQGGAGQPCWSGGLECGADGTCTAGGW